MNHILNSSFSERNDDCYLAYTRLIILLSKGTRQTTIAACPYYKDTDKELNMKCLKQILHIIIILTAEATGETVLF